MYVSIYILLYFSYLYIQCPGQFRQTRFCNFYSSDLGIDTVLEQMYLVSVGSFSFSGALARARISRKTQGSLRRKRKSVSGGSNCKRTLIVTSLYWAQYITSSSNRNRFSEKLKLKFYTILVFSAKITILAICGAHTVYQNGLSVELLHLGLKIN